MHEVDGGEVAAWIEFDPTSHGTPLSFLPPLITSFLFATSSNEKVGAPPCGILENPPHVHWP
jgi:hypothetical protein